MCSNVVTCNYICGANELKVFTFYNMNKQISSQKQDVAKLLQGLRDKTTPLDKELAAEALKVTDVTIWRYLKGEVADLDKGILLAEFLKSRIDNRENKLKELSAA